jgi:hypothetical protein
MTDGYYRTTPGRVGAGGVVPFRVNGARGYPRIVEATSEDLLLKRVQRREWTWKSGVVATPRRRLGMVGATE